MLQRSRLLKLEILIRGIDPPWSWDLGTSTNYQKTMSKSESWRCLHHPPPCPTPRPRIFTFIFDGFWGSLAPRTRGDRFPVSKSPSPTSGTFVASHLTAVFQKKKSKNIWHFLVFLYFLYPLEALWSRDWYSALAVNLVI